MQTRFDVALAMASQAPADQIRKGAENSVEMAPRWPYVTHPVTVVTLVQRFGGTEDQVIAALLHDVLEDGGTEWAEPIRAAFDDKVFALVQSCTDGLPDAQGHKEPLA